LEELLDLALEALLDDGPGAGVALEAWPGATT
jgi:hypothetical protein